MRKRDRKAIEEAREPKERTTVAKFTPVVPRTENQRSVVKTIRNSTVAVITGTSGTGKTLLAVSEALNAIETGEAKKLVLIRPLVAVGESLGYLPGGVIEKIAPYSTALLYYIDELMGSKGFSQKKIDAGVFEVVPVALIRGRTFKDSIIIVDEAQNLTPEQMHAVLTRLGENSKMIIVGDEHQVDLKGRDVESGLSDLLDRMSEHESSFIDSVRLNKQDIQRSEFLKDVYDMYGR